MTRFSMLCFVLIFISNHIQSQTQNCLENLDHPKYQSISQIIANETLTREYIIHIPTNYDASNPSSLVFNLHGFGGCAADFYDLIGDFYEFNALANQENIIVVYPQAAYRSEKEDVYWEPGDNGGLNIYDNDIYFFEQLVTRISVDYNIDMNNIYAIGYSNGGMMAYSLACHKNELFSAIGIMSGAMLDDECTIQSPIPVIIFHGVEDGVLPYDGNIYYRSVSETVDFWLNENGIPASSQVTTELNGTNVVKDEYTGGKGNSCLQLYTVFEEFDKPGDHVWFSDEINGKSPNQIIWDFFAQSCSPVNSMDENEISKSEISINPNPFSERIIIESKLLIGEKFNIVTLQGEILQTGTINSNSHVIDLSKLTPNAYLFKIRESVHKLIKIK